MMLAKLGAGAAAAAYGAGKYGTTLAKSAFSKTVKTARSVFDSSRVRKDVLVKAAGWGSDSLSVLNKGRRDLGVGLKSRFASTTKRKGSAIIRRQTKVGNIGNKIGAVAGIGALGVGAVGMMSVGIMNGMNNSAKDILYERYMQDQRYSRNIMLQSRVGLAMGTNKMNRAGSTMGLSNALSKTRHGAQY